MEVQHGLVGQQVEQAKLEAEQLAAQMESQQAQAAQELMEATGQRDYLLSEVQALEERSAAELAEITTHRDALLAELQDLTDRSAEELSKVTGQRDALQAEWHDLTNRSTAELAEAVEQQEQLVALLEARRAEATPRSGDYSSPATPGRLTAHGKGTAASLASSSASRPRREQGLSKGYEVGRSLAAGPERSPSQVESVTADWLAAARSIAEGAGQTNPVMFHLLIVSVQRKYKRYSLTDSKWRTSGMIPLLGATYSHTNDFAAPLRALTTKVSVQEGR
jgi:hypothetical protein